jgi:hypothetical protein
MLNRLFASLSRLAVIAFTCVAQQEKTEPTKPEEIVARLVGGVADTESVVSKAWVVEWLKQVGKLPPIEPKMKLETDLFAWYTIVRKKANAERENP